MDNLASSFNKFDNLLNILSTDRIFTTFQIEELIKLINSLKIKSAAGPDLINMLISFLLYLFSD